MGSPVELLFWVSLACTVYPYVLYPVLLFLRHRMAAPPEREIVPSASSDELPTVSILVSAYNEEHILNDKLRNLAQIDYPAEKMEILVGSDGSSDGTASVLLDSTVPNVKPNIFSERRGKAAVLNDLVSAATGDIIVFSDANTFYTPDTIQNLLRPFSDPTVGAVCGELRLLSKNNSSGGVGETSYWSYENWIKSYESRIKTTLGATGAVYAIRKALFRPLPTTKVVMDDFLVALNVLKQGYVVKYAADALAFEQPADSVEGEFRRKVRIGAANLHGLSEFSELLHPRHGFIAFALWSHKILRWCVPFFLIAILVSILLLAGTSPFFTLLFWLQAVFFGVALLGLIAERIKINIGMIGFPFYFVAMNAALFVGFIKFLLRRQSPRWEVVR